MRGIAMTIARLRNIALLVAISMLSIPAFAQVPVMSLEEDSTIITPMDTVIVRLQVDGNSVNLKSFSVEIQNSPTVLRTSPLEITEGYLLPTSGLETFFWVDFSPDSQTIYIDGAILGDGTEVNGSGILANIRLSAAGYGISELKITSLRARDAENMPLTYATEGAWVRVCHLLGDVNGDNMVNISDAVYLVAWIFGGGPAPVPDVLSGDVDCSGFTNISDVVVIVGYIFGSSVFCDYCSDWP
jgi:hypothetical protein